MRFETELQHLLPQSKGITLAASSIVGNRQPLHVFDRFRSFRPVHFAAELQRFFPKLESLVCAAGVVIKICQVAHGVNRFGVCRAGRLPEVRQHLLLQFERAVGTIVMVVGNGQLLHRH